MPISVRKTTAVAALAAATTLVLSGCGMTGAGHAMTIEEAQSQAIIEFRSVLALAPDTWPQEVPKAAAYDCRIDGARAVQFGYYVEVDAPDDPGTLVAQAGEHWEREGYELSKTQTEMDPETGQVYAVVARADGKPRASMAATKVRAHVNVDSRCVLGDPDDYR
ncbi:MULTISPECIES: hypothetical protein [unclassified Curtobacterium]|uniref:hypothetical protein n=2 Tax=Curtobacterium TaxID=2034 RepID=UPI0008F0C561|nr:MULTISPECIES: hypothetical protein [unclassified Curtobacterium]SFF91580.1 hypothetical protein SAMN05216329_3268 [Curtobacterium sp. YR515]